MISFFEIFWWFFYCSLVAAIYLELRFTVEMIDGFLSPTE